MNLQRLLVERIEHRIIVGTVAFLATLVLIGWIAISEGRRMEAFAIQYNARAIERGALLFNSTCATCHGVDGRGMINRAPALNNPQLFGHDFLGEVRAERKSLEDELAVEGVTEERTTEINARLAELDQEEASLRQQMQPAIDRGYDPDGFNRLSNLGWGSTLHNFIYTTLYSGRPTSNSYWPEPMAAWSQAASGPLRNDELEDLTQFIMNWDRGDDWTIEDLNAVQQFGIEPARPSEGGDASIPTVETDATVEEILTTLVDFTGDPNSGEALYTAQGCSGCHTAGVVGPLTAGTWTRVNEERMAVPELAALTAEGYLVDSIIHPSNYIVPGFQPVMSSFGGLINYQQLADLMAYLESQDQPAQ